MLQSLVLLALLVALAHCSTIALPTAATQLALNATAQSGVLSASATTSYSLNVPADYRGVATAFYVALASNANCTIQAQISGPADQNWAVNVSLPGRTPVYYNMIADKSGIGVWTIVLSNVGFSSCSYSIAAISMPAQPLALGQGARYDNIDPLAFVHYTFGSANSMASAISVSVTIPGRPDLLTGCLVEVESDPLVGLEEDGTWIATNGSQVFPFSGIYDSGNGVDGEDWSESGFFPIGAAPVDFYIQAQVNSTTSCPTFIVNFVAQPAKPLVVGGEAVQVNGAPVFSDSITWIFSVAQPSTSYSVQISYSSGSCPYVSWAGNDVASASVIKSFNVLGYQAFNSTAKAVTLSGPASKSYIWTVRIAEGDDCVLAVSAF